MISSLASLRELWCCTPFWVLTGFATGMSIMCCGAYALGRSLRYRSWTTAEGKISESFLRKRKSNDKYGCRVYDPVVRYTYHAGGNRFVADIISPHRTAQPKQRGAMLNAYYPVGKKVTVYHHPHLPRMALLQPAPWEKRLALTLVGALLMAGFGMLGLGMRAGTSDRQVAAVQTPLMLTR